MSEYIRREKHSNRDEWEPSHEFLRLFGIFIFTAALAWLPVTRGPWYWFAAFWRGVFIDMGPETAWILGNLITWALVARFLHEVLPHFRPRRPFSHR